jgi:NitT/TauT family transport system ATP-binding protein
MRVEIESKSFGAVEILKNMAFTLEPGSFTVLTGPSGAGKTTLLRILAGLDSDWHGHVGGGERLAYVFQEPRLLPWRSLLDNIRLAAEPAGHGEEASAALAMVGLEEYADAFPGMLSMGMARRAGLARALAVKPDVLLMDEPFVSLDEAAADQLRELTLNLWRAAHPTILMVTHNLKEAISMADRILVMSGRPAGITDDLTLDTPRNQRTGAWMEDISGRVSKAAGTGGAAIDPSPPIDKADDAL